jgi:hypothetical protein
MRTSLPAALLSAFVLPAGLTGAAALQIVRPVIAQSDGGTPVPASFEHVAGETLFFSCRVSGYSKSADDKVHVTYTVQAFDPKGVALTEIYKNEIMTDVAPQDKEWMPKIETEVPIPPLVASGSYRLVVSAEDVLAKTASELMVPFEVRGHQLEPSDTLVVRNFRFYRGEEDTQPVEKAAYRGGDAVWARFDITGFHHGEKNHIDVSYTASVISPSGKVLFTQAEPAVDQSESFYPKRYVAASFAINLLAKTTPGQYAISVTVKDSVGSQTYETKQPFTVE